MLSQLSYNPRNWRMADGMIPKAETSVRLAGDPSPWLVHHPNGGG